MERLDVPISLHYNDMSVAHLMQLTVAMGRWRSRYRLLNGDRGATDQRLASHTLAWLVRGRGPARVCLPAFTAVGFTLLQMAKVLYGVSHRLAYRLFVSALGFCDLAGHTQVRLRGLES